MTPRAAGVLTVRSHGGAIQEIAALIASGRLLALRGVPKQARTPVILRQRELDDIDESSVVSTKATWIRFEVVHHGTREPFIGVRLRIQAPNGATYEDSTNEGGIVEFHDIDDGFCDVECDITEARLQETLGFVSVGDGAAAEVTGTEDTVQRLSSFKARLGWKWISHVDRHKVRTGDTLESIASPSELTASQLAMFNWGVADPVAVNRALFDHVGCITKTPDGRNYILDEKAEPGIIFVPRPWKVAGLATSRTHVIRVSLAAGFRLVLENQDDLRIPHADYEATLADGRRMTGRLGRSGIALIDDPPPGPVEVVYPDEDDIEAKSLAACVRKAFDDRDMEEVFRVLKHSRWMIRETIAMYEKYNNDYSGEGLLADIDREAVDPDDRLAVEALLRIAAVHAEPGDTGASENSTPAEAQEAYL